jgi:hypothetical protein
MDIETKIRLKIRVPRQKRFKVLKTDIFEYLGLTSGDFGLLPPKDVLPSLCILKIAF